MKLGVLSILVSVNSVATISAYAVDSKKTRDRMVIENRDKLQNNDTWIYNDLAKAKEAVAASGKPMMVVFRCIP